MFSSVLFGAYFGILVWGGLYRGTIAFEPSFHCAETESAAS